MQSVTAVTSLFGQVEAVYSCLTRVMIGTRRSHNPRHRTNQPEIHHNHVLIAFDFSVSPPSISVSPYLLCSPPKCAVTAEHVLSPLPDVFCKRPVISGKPPASFNIHFGNAVNLSWNSKKEAFYIQKRGFRTQRSSARTGREADQFPVPFFQKFFEKQRATKELTLGQRPIVDASDAEIGKSVRILSVYNFGQGKGTVRSKFGPYLIPIVLVFFLFYLFKESGSMLLGGMDPLVAEEVDVTFQDVQGVDEAKGELMEIVEYLRDPQKFCRLGARLPKGVLMIGPPGTGKTLLARAVAGEAEVPFFYACGSQFDEVLVGQGARRVRDLFTAAKRHAPSVVFIDEIDSVASRRSNSPLHGPYANQTINQLLTEMDGFKQNEGIIVIAATNRRQDLDKALLRPGRFDVEVQVAPPDFKGRRDIFKLYLDKVKQGNDIDSDGLARGSIGFTGADIENMVNQAALRAAADGMADVTMEYLEQAKDKIIMGPRKKAPIIDNDVTRMTAYHEAGHTLVAFYTKHAMPLHKVTIIPRGLSLGHTAMLPENEHQQMSRGQLFASIDVLMGGRAAEELIFGLEKVTTGASDDLKKATSLAKEMVKTLGMSDKVGLRNFSSDEENIFGKGEEYAPSTAEAIDFEINKILNDSYTRAKDILTRHAKEHKKLAERLVEAETMNKDEIRACIEGKEII